MNGGGLGTQKQRPESNPILEMSQSSLMRRTLDFRQMNLCPGTCYDVCFDGQALSPQNEGVRSGSSTEEVVRVHRNTDSLTISLWDFTSMQALVGSTLPNRKQESGSSVFKCSSVLQLSRDKVSHKVTPPKGSGLDGNGVFADVLVRCLVRRRHWPWPCDDGG